MEYPRELARRGAADTSTLAAFAIGRLILWTLNPGLPFDSLKSALGSPSCGRIAVANPRTAPYGRAAEETLEKLGLADSARPRLVIGETIAQAAQFVETGHADAGFVALSIVLSPSLERRGRWIEVPASLHAPIVQGAILTTRGAANPAARLYLEFLSGPAARGVLRRYGYEIPPEPVPFRAGQAAAIGS
jgi:molybdate transport system substrate-binding protein